jgi:hypothetical protein
MTLYPQGTPSRFEAMSQKYPDVTIDSFFISILISKSHDFENKTLVIRLHKVSLKPCLRIKLLQRGQIS